MTSVEQTAADRLPRELTRFTEALEAIQPVAERRAKGQQFNAYNLSDCGDEKAICIGPITSSPVCLVEASGAAADLIEAALRLASDYAFSAMLAARPKPPADLVRAVIQATDDGDHHPPISQWAAERAVEVVMGARPAPTVEEVRETVHAWIREDANLTVKMNVLPDVVAKLVARIHALFTGEKG